MPDMHVWQEAIIRKDRDETKHGLYARWAAPVNEKLNYAPINYQYSATRM
jgi:hypothetical protein